MARQPFNARWAQGVELQNNANTFQVPSGPRLNSGWEGGQDKDAPPAGQQNYWQNRVDSAMQDLERQGAMTWHAQAIYGLGAPCYATDGYYYESLTAGNTGNSPPLSPAYWRQIGQSLYSSNSVGEYKDVAHNGSPAPGWLKATGAVLLRAAYPKLFAVIGTTYNTGGELSTQFRLPDWRGVFPRCLDDGRGIDSGRTLSNAVQASQNLSHAHTASSASAGGHIHSASSSAAGGHVHAASSDAAGSHIHSAWTDAQGSHAHSVKEGSVTPNGSGDELLASGDDYTRIIGAYSTTTAAGSHAHNVGIGYAGDHSHGIGIGYAGDHAHNIGVSYAGDHAHTISIGGNGGTEARSANLAQVRWIRYL